MKKIIHILHNEKFTTPFYELIANNFDSTEHFFIFLPGVDENKFKIPVAKNVLKITKDSRAFKNKIKLFQLLNEHCKSADKIILHSLLKQDLIRFLFFYRCHLHKCYWVMWGGDVYPRSFSRLTLIDKVKQAINKYIGNTVKSRVGHCITYLRGDYDIARKLYATKGEFHECIMYPSNIFKKLELPEVKNELLTVLIGNSADDSNNHEEIIEKLSAIKDQTFKIICPLSYGPEEHAKKIIELGTSIFRERFIPLIEFMPFEQYLNILADVDIAIFAHDRQQAMGNTITLLGLGKKVYMKSDVVPFTFFQELGVEIYDIDKISFQPLEPLNNSHNSELIADYFSKTHLLDQLSLIFNN